MTTTDRRCALVDANVILDIRTEDATWFEWSSATRSVETAGRMRLAINPIVYAEVSIDAERIEELDDELPEQDYAPFAAVRGRFSWQSIPPVPARRRRATVAVARLLHRSPRSRQRSDAPDTRRSPVSELLPGCRARLSIAGPMVCPPAGADEVLATDPWPQR